MVTTSGGKKEKLDRRLDKNLTGRFSGVPLMLLLLGLVLWITVPGANYPLAWLMENLFAPGEMLRVRLENIHVPPPVFKESNR